MIAWLASDDMNFGSYHGSLCQMPGIEPSHPNRGNMNVQVIWYSY